MKTKEQEQDQEQGRKQGKGQEVGFNEAMGNTQWLFMDLVGNYSILVSKLVYYNKMCHMGF